MTEQYISIPISTNSSLPIVENDEKFSKSSLHGIRGGSTTNKQRKTSHACSGVRSVFVSSVSLVALKRADLVQGHVLLLLCSTRLPLLRRRLSAEAVQGAALTLQSVDDVHGRHRLSLGVFGVRDGVADHVLEEHLEHAASLLVDQARDTLHATTTGKTTDCRLRDALDVVAQHLAMTLGASLAESFASLSTSRHACS